MPRHTRTSKVNAGEIFTTSETPPLDKLLDSLRYRHCRSHRVYVETECGLTFVMNVTGMKIIDNAPTGWEVEGYALDPTGTVTSRNWRSFIARLDTLSRKGTIGFTE